MGVPKDLVAASATPLILSILTEGDSYGYAIIQRVRELSGGQMHWTGRWHADYGPNRLLIACARMLATSDLLRWATKPKTRPSTKMASAPPARDVRCSQRRPWNHQPGK